MKRSIIFLAAVGILLLISSSILAVKEINSSARRDQSTLTKAICTPENYCEDYQITCEEKKVTKLTPTGAAVQFSENWQDPRTNEEKEINCD
jgi:hypothetical protein